MAIHPREPPTHATAAAPASTGEPSATVNVDAWISAATSTLQSVTLGGSHPHASETTQPPVAGASVIALQQQQQQQQQRARSVSLAIPLDGSVASHDGWGPSKAQGPDHVRGPRREPLRRDSLKRREALLRGKEGSRRRQRWENDRLLDNKHVVPPLPSDWEVHPTYPRLSTVPYYLAPLWEEGAAVRAAMDKKCRDAKASKLDAGDATSKVPKELREKLKKTRTARGLLQDLETQVRDFVERWMHPEEETEVEMDSEDEEIVFVGRNERFSDRSAKADEIERRSMVRARERNKLIFDSRLDDQGASFGRWLVHSIASYYGLRTWSITVGDPARREAYIGISEIKPAKSGSEISCFAKGLPRPLWDLV